MGHTGTSGGNRLRALREASGKTQLTVELDASLGSGYLQRVESGKVERPERETLERILAALGARYTERRDILEMFGYVVDTPLPDDAEIEWAIHACQPELHDVAFPAYLLDCAHRLLAWNPLASRLFNTDVEARLTHMSMLKVLFDPGHGIAPLIHNPAEFYPASIRALRYQMQVFHGEPWYTELIEDLLEHVPNFRRYWLSTESDRIYPTAARPLTPIEFKLPSVGLLKFWLTSESFVQDRRFRVMYYLPADAATIQQCAAWSEGQRPAPLANPAD
jgi:transcriptional regulator with XRE-family HTH domain